jgi:hypothetical protein
VKIADLKIFMYFLGIKSYNILIILLIKEIDVK